MVVLRRLACVVLVCLAGSPAPGETPPEKKPFAELLAEAQARSKEGKWAEAAPLWKQLAARNPTQGNYALQLGKALYERKEYRQAIPPYTRAFELRTGYPANSAYNIACCHALLGEKKPALRWLETALNRGFRDLVHAQTDDDFASIRDDPKYRELVLLVDTSKLSRDEGWRHDLKLAAREIKRLHFNPFREVTRAQFDAHVRKLHDDIPKLTDAQVTVGLMKLARMAGDGHTHLRPGGSIGQLP